MGITGTKSLTMADCPADLTVMGVNGQMSMEDARKEYVQVQSLGEGAFGEAWLIRHITEDKQYVLKRMNIEDQDSIDVAMNELDVLSAVQHQNIVAYKGFIIDKSKTSLSVNILMEYCDGGDIEHVIRKHKGGPFGPKEYLPEDQITSWIQQICLALEYLHCRHCPAILHRDLKPANIFLMKDNTLKLGDFGIARKLAAPGAKVQTLCGTPQYLSPEIMLEQPYDDKGDIWALGCVLYELMTLEVATIVDWDRRRYSMNPMPKNYSGVMINLTRHLMTENASRRPGITEVLQHPLFQKVRRQNSTRPKRPVPKLPTVQPINHGYKKLSTDDDGYEAPRTPTDSDEKSQPVQGQNLLEQNGIKAGPPVPIRDSDPQAGLRRLGFKVDPDMVLRGLNGELFKYDVMGSQDKDEQRYLDICEELTSYTYQLLETKFNMKRLMLPLDGPEYEPKYFIYHTPDAFTNTDKLLILVHGAGNVRVGQWSRRIMINESLEAGSQIPWVQNAIDDGYAVILLNSNYNNLIVDGVEFIIRKSETPTRHIMCTWDTVIVPKCPAKHIAFGAHSFGGKLVAELAVAKEKVFLEKVFAVVLAESTHKKSALSKAIGKFYSKHARNWLLSDKPLPLDVQISSEKHDAPTFSAGEKLHERTPWTAMTPAFKFIKEQYNAKKSNV